MKPIKRWIDNKITPTPITMNVSPNHLTNDKFVDYLIDIRDKYLIKNDLIILEIPERGLSNITPQITQIIYRLHDEGFILCIDGFGSINSPLNLLKDLPIDRIQVAVENYFIIHTYVSCDRTDYNTLIPVLKKHDLQRRLLLLLQ